MKITTALILCLLMVIATHSLDAAESEVITGQVPSEMPNSSASAAKGTDIPFSALTMRSFELIVCTHQTEKVACESGLIAGGEPGKPASISRGLDVRENQEIVFVSYEPLSSDNLLYFTLLKTSIDGRSAKVSAASIGNRPGKKITLTIKVLVATK